MKDGTIMKIGGKDVFIKFGESISKQIIEQTQPKMIEIKKIEKPIKDYRKKSK